MADLPSSPPALPTFSWYNQSGEREIKFPISFLSVSGWCYLRETLRLLVGCRGLLDWDRSNTCSHIPSAW